jgi:hypothetical protein
MKKLCKEIEIRDGAMVREGYNKGILKADDEYKGINRELTGSHQGVDRESLTDKSWL